MKKQSLLILLIVLAGSSASIAYGVGTVVTDSGITTGNLTITGTCTGCGGEASYSSWTTLQQEGTLATGGMIENQVLIDNNGNLVVNFGAATGTTQTWLVSNLGSTTSFTSSAGPAVSAAFITQTTSGQYQAIWNDGAKVIDLYTNGTLAANVPLDFAAKFKTGQPVGIAISPNGHWLAAIGIDFTDNSKNRFQIYRGI